LSAVTALYHLTFIIFNNEIWQSLNTFGFYLLKDLSKTAVEAVWTNS